MDNRTSGILPDDDHFVFVSNRYDVVLGVFLYEAVFFRVYSRFPSSFWIPRYTYYLHFCVLHLSTYVLTHQSSRKR